MRRRLIAMDTLNTRNYFSMDNNAKRITGGLSLVD